MRMPIIRTALSAWTRKSFFTAVAAVLPALLPLLSASATTITASADTYITEHPVLGGPNSTHGTDPLLVEIGPNTFRTYPLVRFDLSGFAGQIVTGPVTLSLNVASIFPGATQVTQSLEAFQVLVPWNEATVSWNSFGPGPIFGTNVGATALEPLFTVTVMPGSIVNFSLPAALLQEWINDPSTNDGLLLFSTTTIVDQDIHFASTSAAGRRWRRDRG
jgi:hypothetical protein